MFGIKKIELTKRLAPVNERLDMGIKNYIKEMTEMGFQSLERRSPNKTHTLRSSYGKKLELDKFKATITTNSPYFWFVENDTKPHIIRPKGGRGVMVFNIGFATIFATYPTKDGKEGIEHTGTKGQHMLRETVTELRSDRVRVFRKHISGLDRK